MENTVLMVTDILSARVDENTWVIDSSCTSHVTNQIDALLNAQPVSGKITVGNGNTEKITQKGTIK